MTVYNEIPPIETERLLLRPLRAEDAMDLFENLSDREVTEHMGISPMKNVEEAKEMISFLNELAEKDIAIRWGIVQKSDRKLVGTCGFNAWEENRGSRVEIAYDLGKPFWKKGYMTEVIEQLLTVCFETIGFNRVEAFTNLDAAPSINLLKKFNFKQDGILREYAYFHGEYVDQRCFSLLRKEWVLRKRS